MTAHRLPVDERVIGAATTVRFALLVILLLVSSASMILDVITGLSGQNDLDGLGCEFAAGADPLHSSETAVQAHGLAQNAAFDACLARYEPPPSWWVTLGWPILVSTMAIALFWGLPAWKRRHGRVVPLAVIDHDGTIAAELAGLATTVAGLARIPRFLVDPAARSGNAVVFGSNRRPTIRLHGGLMVLRTKDPDAFRAVVLHELAHIRNGDVTVTYLTVAMWQVFLALVLLPYLVWTAVEFAIGQGLADWSIEAPGVARNVLFTVLMVALIYLARSDVLRSREIYADLAAVSWGAHEHGWSDPTTPPVRGALRRFVELWRTHPQMDLRRASLTDPAALFGVQALPLFLTGAAAALVAAQADTYVAHYLHDITWSNEVIAVGVAVLVTAVAGTMLWRAAAHSMLTGRPAPSGVRAGLWLGAGMAVADLVLDDLTAYHWLPEQPEVLLVVVGAGMVFACWTTQCAQLWLRVWPGPVIRPAVLIGLVTGCLVLSGWFEWWLSVGAQYAYGVFGMLWADGISRFRGDQAAALAASVSDVTTGWLVFPAVATLWVVPLLVWAIAKGTAIPRWVRLAQRRIGDLLPPVSGLPPLRRTMLAALLGGLFGWVAFVGVMAYRHAVQPPGPLGTTEQPTAVFMVWLLVAWVAGMVVAAAVASPAAGRYGLLAALIASQTAGLVGFVGMFPLAAFDGCVPGLATLRGSCAWRPDMTWPMFSYLTEPAFVVGAVAAVAVAAFVFAVQRPAVTATLALATSRSQVVRGVIAAALAVMVVGLVIASRLPTAETSTLPQSPIVADDAPPSAQTRAYQVSAWFSHGGGDLLTRFTTVATRYVDLLDKGKGEVDGSQVHPFCVDFDRLAADADAYFQVPDPQAQSLWRKFIAQNRTIGQDCDKAVDRSDGDLLVKSAKDADQTAVTGNAVGVRILEVTNVGTG